MFLLYIAEILVSYISKHLIVSLTEKIRRQLKKVKELRFVDLLNYSGVSDIMSISGSKKKNKWFRGKEVLYLVLATFLSLTFFQKKTNKENIMRILYNQKVI